MLISAAVALELLTAAAFFECTALLQAVIAHLLLAVISGRAVISSSALGVAATNLVDALLRVTEHSGSDGDSLVLAARRLLLAAAAGTAAEHRPLLPERGVEAALALRLLAAFPCSVWTRELTPMASAAAGVAACLIAAQPPGACAATPACLRLLRHTLPVARVGPALAPGEGSRKPSKRRRAAAPTDSAAIIQIYCRVVERGLSAGSLLAATQCRAMLPELAGLAVGDDTPALGTALLSSAAASARRALHGAAAVQQQAHLLSAWAGLLLSSGVAATGPADAWPTAEDTQATATLAAALGAQCRDATVDPAGVQALGAAAQLLLCVSAAGSDTANTAFPEALEALGVAACGTGRSTDHSADHSTDRSEAADSAVAALCCLCPKVPLVADGAHTQLAFTAAVAALRCVPATLQRGLLARHALQCAVLLLLAHSPSALRRSMLDMLSAAVAASVTHHRHPAAAAVPPALSLALREEELPSALEVLNMAAAHTAFADDTGGAAGAKQLAPLLRLMMPLSARWATSPPSSRTSLDALLWLHTQVVRAFSSSLRRLPGSASDREPRVVVSALAAASNALDCTVSPRPDVLWGAAAPVYALLSSVSQLCSVIVGQHSRAMRSSMPALLPLLLMFVRLPFSVATLLAKLERGGTVVDADVVVTTERRQRRTLALQRIAVDVAGLASRLLEVVCLEEQATRKHVVYVLAEFASNSATVPLPPLVRRALLPGIFRVMDICDRHDMQQVFVGASPASRAMLQSLRLAYRSAHKYFGQA